MAAARTHSLSHFHVQEIYAIEQAVHFPNRAKKAAPEAGLKKFQEKKPRQNERREGENPKIDGISSSPEKTGVKDTIKIREGGEVRGKKRDLEKGRTDQKPGRNKIS